MKRVVSFVDGFNLYHALREEPECDKYRWLDLWSLSEAFIAKSKEKLVKTYYFTAFYHAKPNGVVRHKTYINALLTRNVEVVFGKYKKRDRYCNSCKKTFVTHEEKQTDVNIAIHLLKLAYLDMFDKAIVISADSDLIASIKAVKELFPKKEICIVFPVGRHSAELENISDEHKRIKHKHLFNNQLPEKISGVNGQYIEKPKTWY